MANSEQWKVNREQRTVNRKKKKEKRKKKNLLMAEGSSLFYFYRGLTYEKLIYKLLRLL